MVFKRVSIKGYRVIDGPKTNNTFEKEEGEKIDRVLVLFVEFVLNKGEFDLAEKILSEVNKFHKDRSISIEEIRGEMPDEFEKAVEVLEKEVTDDEV